MASLVSTSRGTRSAMLWETGVNPDIFSNIGGGGVSSFIILQSGTGWSGTPTFTITGDGTGATVTGFTISGGGIVNIVVSPGSGYTFATISASGTGTGFIASLTVGQGAQLDYASKEVDGQGMRRVAFLDQCESAGGPGNPPSGATRYSLARSD